MSQRKSILALLGSLAFVVASVWIALRPELFHPFELDLPVLARALGLSGAAFFGACMLAIVRGLQLSGPGLIIDDEGITDRSTPSSVGLIRWGDIRAIDARVVAGTRLLDIRTTDSEKYIARGSNWLVRAGLRINRRLYGSPLVISATPLAIGDEALETLLQRELAARAQSANQN